MMGVGDELMGAGMARGAAALGRRVAFGDGRRILWHKNAHEIFRGNPNVAPPGQEHSPNIDWLPHYPGHRMYFKSIDSQRIVFDPSFKAIPGEVFFTEYELMKARDVAREIGPFVLIEPNTKPQAINKRWPYENSRAVATLLARQGVRVAQFSTGGLILNGVRQIPTADFRSALSILQLAALYIGPEGGLHHGAAAVGTKAVVIFGGFIDPKTTGYKTHVNLFTGGTACGSKQPCRHCDEAMRKITPEMVFDAAMEQLR